MSDPVSLLPWQSTDWERIAGAVETLHHGLMLSGQSGVGKREFATLLARKLLCQQPGDSACGACQNCRLFDAGTHPDLHVIATEREAVNGRIELLGSYADRYQDSVARDKKTNPGVVITVDQIRRLIDRFYRASHISSRRVALIVDADRMNVNAANALLKLLEEPPENAHFILLSADPAMLPPTVRSRCLVEDLGGPDREEAFQWIQRQCESENLQLGSAAQSIIRASRSGPIDILARISAGVLDLQISNQKLLLELLSGRLDPVEGASALSKQEITELLLWMQQCCADLIRGCASGRQLDWLTDRTLLSRLDVARLHAVYDKISYYRRLAREQLNGQLALEELLIALRQAA